MITFLLPLRQKTNNLMKSYIIWGKIDPKSFTMKSKKEDILEIKTPVQIKNMTYESALIYKDVALFLYEANGKNLQKKCIPRKFSL